MTNEMNVKPTAIHEKASILVPTSAWIFRSDCDVKAYLKIRDMAVPMAAATVARMKAMKDKMPTGILHHLE